MSFTIAFDRMFITKSYKEVMWPYGEVIKQLF